jgi:hypothetical protein
MPVALHFTWNFPETDLFNLTGDPYNVNLIGAITRLQPLLTMNAISPGNIVVLEFGAFVIIAGLLWLLSRKTRGNAPSVSSSSPAPSVRITQT